MKFCSNCGSYMKETAKGLQCPRCGKLIPLEPQPGIVHEKSRNKRDSDIYIINKANESSAITAQPCPKCGHQYALHWVSSISGEHAGVRRERTVEHFRCVKCSYSWTKSS